MRHSSLFILSLSLVCAQVAFAQIIEDTPLIQTVGTAIVYAEPDEVLMSFTILTDGEDLQDAKARNNQISKEAIVYLKGSGVDPKHIQTRYLNVGKRYRDYRRPNETIYYEASQSFNICITDMENYEEIMMGLLSLDIHNISSPTFRTTAYRELMDEARGKAVLAAKEKAQSMATQLNQEIGVAYSIIEVDLNNRWRVDQNAYANVSSGEVQASMDTEMGFAKGQLEIKAVVNVSFRLLD